MNPIVIDSNILIKLFSNESDSQQAKKFIAACIAKDYELFAPSLLMYEVLAIASKKKAAFLETVNVLEKHTNSILTIVSPDHNTWLKANEMTQYGSSKSGFPSLYDSIYHALAITMHGVFITADKKHYEKTKGIESILILENWESLFALTQ